MKTPPVRHVRRAALCAFTAALTISVPRAAGAADAEGAPPRSTPLQYRISATLDSSKHRVAGTATVRFVNTSTAVLHDAVFVLFANRFANDDGDAINDFNRPFVYPDEEFDAGWSKVVEARDGDAPSTVEPLSRSYVPDGCLVRMPMRPLAPGETRTLTLKFETRIPRRFGTFGVFDDQVTLLGGWHPYLAALDNGGTWRDDLEPPLADFEVWIARRAAEEVIVNGHSFPPGAEDAYVELHDVHFVAVISAPRFERFETSAGGTRVILFQRPKRRAWRLAPGPKPTDLLLETVSAVLAERPAVLTSVPDTMVVVEAPLRLNLTANAEGAVVVSDRTLEVHRLLHPFHELQIAQAVYQESIRPMVARRESPGDYWWGAEGSSYLLARRFVVERRAKTRSVYDWIELFNFFAVVDRFESAPKIPFVESFFERTRVADPLRSEVLTFNNELPPGRVILGKLANRVGRESFDRVIDQCLASAAPFRRCAHDASGTDLNGFFAEWLLPYPALNYRVADVERNERTATGFKTSVTVERESSRSVSEPVTVRLKSLWHAPEDVVWDGIGDKGTVEAETEHRVTQVVLDPNRDLIEDRRDDNSRPRSPQLVLDTANVEVSSTEFGFGALAVGRLRYDYRRDIGIAGSYTNRATGITVGPRLHWGTPIDPTLFRQNLYLFYGFQELDKDFHDKSRPAFRTAGEQASFGLRYDYTNVYAFDNPTRARNLRLFTDWYDRSIGSDYDYVSWGIDASLTQPLGSYRTIGALEILNGFSEALNGSFIPNQGLYSLGGSRSIRGIGAEDKLGPNILLVRTELRQSIYPEIDFNLLDAVVLRRSQVRLFVDAGQVDDDTGKVYDVSKFAVGVGLGLGMVYDFMGFFPSLAFIEVATRVDEPDQADDVQFLFGTRQTF